MPPTVSEEPMEGCLPASALVRPTTLVMASHELDLDALEQPIVFLPVLVGASILMVSRIPFGSYKRFRSRPRQIGFYATVAGGVTTVADMPNHNPPPTTAKTFGSKLDLVGAKSYVDFALFAGGMETKEYPALAEAGACGVKLFQFRSSVKGSPYLDQLCVMDEGQLYDVFEGGRKGRPARVPSRRQPSHHQSAPRPPARTGALQSVGLS